MEKYVMGIDVGGTSVKLAALTTSGNILSQWSIPTRSEDNGSQIVPDIIASLDQFLAERDLAIDNFLGVGIGTPGAINRDAGTVTGAYNLNWKQEQFIRQAFIDHYGDLPVYIENDANVAALGEQWLGAGDKAPNMVLVTLGTGVGGGVIVNDQLVIGAGAAGEIGHMLANPDDGFQCTCGNQGCLETVASASGIVWTAEKRAKETTIDSELVTNIQSGKEVTTKDIFDAAQNEDIFAEEIVDETMSYLGHALGQIASVLNPEAIVIGGGVANAGEYLISKVKSHFLPHVYPSIRETTDIRLASLGNTAGVIGSASLVLKQQ
ncbi:MAG: ROK family glucokinase [Aerococcus suis]|nr:ROK family glucokinase [Aerococcus suis]